MSIPDLVAGLLGDVLSLKGVPGAGALGAAAAAVKLLQEKRLAAARETFMEEIARGEVLPARAAADDTLICAIYRYGRSAQEGTARRNLQLMAPVIRNGMARADFYADDFLRYAALLESLSREEIILLAMAYRRQLSGEPGRFLELAGKDLVDQGTFTQDDLFRIQQALLRTGLISMGVINNAPVFGGTSLLTELGRLSELEALDLSER